MDFSFFSTLKHTKTCFILVAVSSCLIKNFACSKIMHKLKFQFVVEAKMFGLVMIHERTLFETNVNSHPRSFALILLLDIFTSSHVQEIEHLVWHWISSEINFFFQGAKNFKCQFFDLKMSEKLTFLGHEKNAFIVEMRFCRKESFEISLNVTNVFSLGFIWFLSLLKGFTD